MMQAKKIKYDVIGLTEPTQRNHLNAVYENGEELFLGTCDSRGVGGVGVFVKSMPKNIDFFQQLTTQIGRLRMRRCGPTPALTIFVACAPTSSYEEEEEVEVFYMDLKKFYREDHAFYKVIIGEFNAKIGFQKNALHIGSHGLQWNEQGEKFSEFIMKTKTIHKNSQFKKPSSLRWTWKLPDVAVVPKFYTRSDHRLLRGRFSFTRIEETAAKFRERNSRTIINWDLSATLAGFWEESAMDNMDEKYDRLVEHLHDCTVEAESLKTTKRGMSLETLGLIRQSGAARAGKETSDPRFEKVLDEEQPCEQTGFRKGFSTIDHIHTCFETHRGITRVQDAALSHVHRLEEGLRLIETEAVMEALDNQSVSTHYIKVLRELCSNFATEISPFYKNIIDVRRGVRQGDTISPKIFTATLENAMRKLEWDDMGVKVDGRQLHHLCFVDDIVLITPSISQAERMLTEFDETCG
ncbi:hypothetical protein RB195_012025 [Necator americanus]|uniref:Reverse transcriptase domain-containing protein n=1 Tax=Necator americanus TaxID=51031 RepID=A0ABR1D545_NECAM